MKRDTFRITQRGTGVVIVLDVDAADTYADKLAIADSIEDAVNDDADYDVYSDARVTVLSAWQSSEEDKIRGIMKQTVTLCLTKNSGGLITTTLGGKVMRTFLNEEDRAYGYFDGMHRGLEVMGVLVKVRYFSEN